MARGDEGGRGSIYIGPYDALVLKDRAIERVGIFDTTLRDGEQSPGIALTPDEKMHVLRAIDSLGVDAIEVGFAASSEQDREAVRRAAAMKTDAEICSLARSIDADVDAVADAGCGYVHTFIATSEMHMRCKLRMTPDQVVERAVGAIEHAKSRGLKVQFSCEDASRTELGFLKRAVAAAEDAGADVIDVPDTVGALVPSAMSYLIRELKRTVKVPLAVHCHNDLGLAVANSLAALEAGAEIAHVCVNGLGERSGNTALEELAAALYVDYGVETVDMSKLGPASKTVSRYTGYPIAFNKPIVGRNAFAHESGIHVQGVLSNSATYELFPPELVGMARDIRIGKHSGSHSVMGRLRALGIGFPEALLPDLMADVKGVAAGGREVDDIELAALAENAIWKGRTAENVRLKEFTVVTGKNATPTATVTIEVDGAARTCAQTGIGPVDAAVNAIRGALDERIALEELRLEAITGGSDSLCEVTVLIRDVGGGGAVTAGKAVGLDIVDTSVDAIMQAINRGYARRAETGGTEHDRAEHQAGVQRPGGGGGRLPGAGAGQQGVREVGGGRRGHLVRDGGG